MSAVAQCGDILFPQLDQPMPGIVPVGIDQDPHLRLCRDVARRFSEKYKFVLPSSIYNKYTPALDGGVKMSKSKPESCVEMPEETTAVQKKIKRAFTGGRDTVEEQKKIGGQPEKCMIFELYKQHLIEDDGKLEQVFKTCKAGTLLCGQDKEDASEVLSAFMDDFQKKVEKARGLVSGLRFIE